MNIQYFIKIKYLFNYLEVVLIGAPKNGLYRGGIFKVAKI